MRRLADAQRHVLDAMTRLDSVATPLSDAGGLVLAADVVAPHPVPPFANSGMDGYAVRAADIADPPVVVRVLEDLPAGSVPSRVVTSGTAIKIMTGAPIPDGADAVVPVEDSEPAGEESVRLLASGRVGDHVRPAGGDIAAGDVVLAAGTRLAPIHLGLLASVGMSHPVVSRRPTVAVLSTGDELVGSDTAELRPGAIRDSNRPLLVAALEDLGVRVLDLGIIPDDERLLRSALGEAAAAADAVVTSGGVSMGEYDLVKQVLTELGTVEFWKVAMQPAKPFAFGFLGATPLFGLPGNPVSVFVAFEQFVRPALLHRMGSNRLFRPRSMATLGEPVSTHPEKEVFLRVVAEEVGGAVVVRPSGGQGSNVLSALAAADGFAVVPVGTGDLASGAEVAVEWMHRPERRTKQEVLGG